MQGLGIEELGIRAGQKTAPMYWSEYDVKNVEKRVIIQ